MKVSADGRGVVSHAGVGMLREVADLTGLCRQVTAAFLGVHIVAWREGRRCHAEIVDAWRRVHSRETAFALAYRRRPLEPPLQRWSRPTSYNEPLPPPTPTGGPPVMKPEALQALQDEAVRTAPGRYEEVGCGDAGAWACMEDHDEAAQRRATGDPLDAITADGLDQSAGALVDSEIATWPDERDNPASGVIDPGVLPWSDASRP
jgi:hypothetical protein